MSLGWSPGAFFQPGWQEMVVSRKRAAWRRMPDMEGGCWWREASVTPWRPRPTLPTHLASYQCPSMGNAPKSCWVKRPQRWLEQGGGGEARQGQAFSTARALEHFSALGRENAMFSGQGGLGQEQGLLSQVRVVVPGPPS